MHKINHQAIRQSYSPTTRRIGWALMALAGFASLYVFDRHLAGHIGLLGLPDRMVHRVGHILVYGSLAVLVAKALRRRWVLAWFVSILLATAEEYHQLFVPGRYASVDDALVNLTTISCFLIGAYLFQTKLRPSARALLGG